MLNKDIRQSALNYRGEAIAATATVAPDYDHRLSMRSAAQATTRVLRCISINTHRGQGPKLPYLLSQASLEESERIALLHDARAYTYYMAEWLNQRREDYDVVGLQEVFNGGLSLLNRLLGKFRQRDHYRVISGFGSAIAHGVGFAGFKYENLLLSQLKRLSGTQINYLLPGKIYFLAECGYTLAPFQFEGREIWVGNTHLHPYNPKTRARQAASIAAEMEKLGDVPVIFLGDLNTVPPGCRDTGFTAGERDRTSYINDQTIEILTSGGLQMVPHEDNERFYTYPTGLPNRTLDYILFTRHWEVNSYQVVKDFKFSDHYPVLGEFSLRG